MIQHQKKNIILIITKSIFALIFPILCVFLNGMSKRYVVVAFTDILFINLITIFLLQKNKLLGYLLNSFALFVMNIEFASLYWANSFVGAYMLTNLDFVGEISGNFHKYFGTVATLLVFSFLSIGKIEIKKTMKRLVFVAGAFIIFSYTTFFVSKSYKKSFSYGIYAVLRDFYNMHEEKKFLVLLNDTEKLKKDFYKETVGNYIKKPASLAEKPNIILIFTEGFSQNIVDDDRNITPNIREFQKKSLTFKNYYNHTFATFMGLQGQLYSGYQQNNYDKTSLVSIQNILKNNGYNTYYILTEPRSPEMVEYITDMKFDEVITETDENALRGVSLSISDKDAYEILYKKALEKKSNKIPFFMAMYTLGTHCSIDSIDEKFGDGSNIVLNRFYDMDTQFGKFLKKFNESNLKENTLLILTTDHASYQDNDFSRTFPDYKRNYIWLDRIPLSFYYKDVEPRFVDVNGRNSIDLSPTILDFVDIDGEQYFLGESLFSNLPPNDYETTFQSLGVYISTENSNPTDFSAKQRKHIKESIRKYFALKAK